MRKFDPIGYIRNAWDYINCVLRASGGSYKALYLEQEVLTIGEKKQINVKMRPVQFEEDDEVACIPNCTVIPGSNIVESDIIEDLMFDRDRSIVFMLEARLYGADKDDVSMWDIRKNRLKRPHMIFSFIKQTIYQSHQKENVRVGSILNYPPISYKELVSLA